MRRIFAFTLLTVEIVVQISLCVSGQRVEVVSELVNDVIKNENVPSILSAKTCWSKADDFYFVKSSSISVQINIGSTLSLSISVDRINKLWVFIDMSCAESVRFLREIDEMFFAHPYRWILLQPLQEHLTNLSFLADSNIILVHFDDETDSFDLKQIYKFDRDNKDFIGETFGKWDASDGLTDLRVSKVLSRRRRNLMGTLLKASLILLNNNSINHLEDLRDSHVDSVSKTGYVITNRLVESLNATISYNITNTWGYGDIKSKKIDGMFGQLIRNEVDIGATIIFMTPERVPYIEYLSMTTPTRAAFVFRPPPLSYVSNIYYLPFAGIVWACAGILVILCTFILYLTYRFPSAQDRNLVTSDFLLFGVGTICQMGSQMKPKKISAKIASFAFCVALIFVYTSYAANIVALLQSTAKSITTLTDLLHSNMEFGVEDTPYTRHFFSVMTEPVRKKIYQTKIVPQNQRDRFMNLSYGVSRMRGGLFAFHMEMGIGYKHVKKTFHENEKCGLVEISYLQVIDPWYSVQKRSPYKEIFKVNIFKIREHGIQGRENARIYTKRPACNSNGQNFDSVRLIDCYAALLVLCYGLAASLGVLTMERVVKGKLQRFFRDNIQ